MKYLYLLIISVCLTSCECAVNHSAYISDSNTKEPIGGAKVIVNTEKKGKESLFSEFYTDSLGFFKIAGLANATYGCPGLRIYIEKEGYKTHTIIVSDLGDTSIIYLEKQ